MFFHPLKQSARGIQGGSLEGSQVLNCFGDLRDRVTCRLPAGGDVTIIPMLFQQAEDVRKIDSPHSPLGIFPSTTGKITNRIGGMDMGNMGGKQPDSLPRGKAIDHQLPWIQVDVQHTIREGLQQLLQMGWLLASGGGRQHRSNMLTVPS